VEISKVVRSKKAISPDPDVLSEKFAILSKIISDEGESQNKRGPDLYSKIERVQLARNTRNIQRKLMNLTQQ
jgi:hypothetical protein